MSRADDGRGAYPDGALWADPDLDAAAAWMRRLASDDELRGTLTSNARTRMERQATEREVGVLYERVLAAR